MAPLAFEDFMVGETVHLGSRTIDRDEIIAFAREFDPQPMHLDEQAARQTLLGGLCASGWHSCALLMRMICDAYLAESPGLGSPGLDEVRWLKPVFPGDTLTAKMTCREKRTSNSRPGVGICRLFYEMENQTGDCVMTWMCVQMFRAGTDEPAAPGETP